MPKHILFVVFIVLAVEGYSQKKVENKVDAIPNKALDTKSIAPIIKLPCSIEINPFFRYDDYPEFLSEVRPTDNYFVKLQGNSFGLNLNYKMPLLKRLKLLAGIGYYKNRIDKIVGRNRRGQNDNRLIAILPPPPIFLPYFTDKYFYHCLSMNIGIENNFRLSKNYLLPVGAILQNNFTFSQYYHLTNNPIGSLDYKRKASSVKLNVIWRIKCTFEKLSNGNTI